MEYYMTQRRKSKRYIKVKSRYSYTYDNATYEFDEYLSIEDYFRRGRSEVFVATRGHFKPEESEKISEKIYIEALEKHITQLLAFDGEAFRQHVFGCHQYILVNNDEILMIGLPKLSEPNLTDRMSIFNFYKNLNTAHLEKMPKELFNKIRDEFIKLLRAF